MTHWGSLNNSKASKIIHYAN
eukprot:SAG11_NODE_5424_length_1564_cov_1.593174_2_plen_20_part_01